MFLPRSLTTDASGLPDVALDVIAALSPLLCSTLARAPHGHPGVNGSNGPDGRAGVRLLPCAVLDVLRLYVRGEVVVGAEAKRAAALPSDHALTALLEIWGARPGAGAPEKAPNVGSLFGAHNPGGGGGGEKVVSLKATRPVTAPSGGGRPLQLRCSPEL
ncbi:hypothetical protein T484DRAFT_1776353 [Baffinella frigidus]|nr:hypothetical protein T484DRAFT_1776353 [Cryptophyta sp. CCMP2293]